MIFVRNGPRFVYLNTTDLNFLVNELILKLNAQDLTFSESLEQAKENETILLLVSENNFNPVIDNAQKILLIPLETTLLFSSLLNLNLIKYIKESRVGPSILVQRIPPRGKKVIDFIQKDYKAQTLLLKDAIDIGKADETVITFTENHIHRLLKTEYLMDTTLLIKKPLSTVGSQIKRRAIRYFTEAINDMRWYELRINIYDAAGLYDEHYLRLITALEDLDAGLILEESWTKDHALTLFSVMAYQVKVVTFLDPYELKQILVGLEYDKSGERFVDFDLYYRSRKIQWVETSLHPKSGRHKTGVEFRNNLTNILSEEAKAALSLIEEEINKR